MMAAHLCLVMPLPPVLTGQFWGDLTPQQRSGGCKIPANVMKIQSWMEEELFAAAAAGRPSSTAANLGGDSPGSEFLSFCAVPPRQVVAVDPDLGENGTVVYSIRPPNKFYSLNSTTGKIRTSGVLLDRENPNAQEAQLMRRIVVSVTDCKLPSHTACFSC